MTEISKFFKPSLVALEPYSSARDEYSGSDGIFLDANENGFDFAYNRYPDPYQTELKNAIGQWRNIDVEKIFLGNGSDEIIDLLIRSTCVSGRDRILSLDPSYGMYRVSSSINEVPLDLVELNADFSIDEQGLFATLKDHHKLIFICSPNNPNGGIIENEVIEKVLSKSKGLVVIDEAYIDFSATESWLAKLKNYKNLIVLQTFSKSLGAAGIRLGMAFMQEEMVAFLNKIKPPYNISVPNQNAALSRLAILPEIAKTVDRIVEERERLEQALIKLTMVHYVFPSNANFLLVRFSNAQIVFSELKLKMIIVRDRSKQKNCQECLRITIGTADENRILLEALKEIDRKMKSKS